jgi:glycosyltransferase involved in cell wall biosynthesis
MHIVTVTFPYALPGARALGRSLRAHHPDWEFEVVLVGHPPRCEEEFPVTSAGELFGIDAYECIARYHPSDLLSLLVPRVLEARASEGMAAFHLPGSAWVLGDLGKLAQLAEERPVALTPRSSADVPDDGRQPSPSQLAAAGRIDPLVMGSNGSPGALSFLRWWSVHVERGLGRLDGEDPGWRVEDRHWVWRYLELAAALFRTELVDRPGLNFSKWNAHERTLELRDGEILANGEPLGFVNLPGFDPLRPFQLAADASRARTSRSAALREVCRRYAQELVRAGALEGVSRGAIGRRLPGGVTYDDTLWALHLQAEACGVELGDVFSPAGAEAFNAWLAGPAPHGAAHGVNRYVYQRVARERPDVLTAYPDIDGEDGPEYVAWCHSFGRQELGLAERFLPPRPGSVSGAPARSAPAARSGGSISPWDGESSAGEVAVRVSGYLGHTLGLGAAARGYAEALQAAGVRVFTASVPLDHVARPDDLDAAYGLQEYQDGDAPAMRHGAELLCVNPDELPEFVSRVGAESLRRPRIGVWGWEVANIPERWREALALVDEVWVYSKFMAENFAALPVPVRALPPPVPVAAGVVEPLRLGVPPGFLFLFVFDYMSTVQRKNPVGVIDAFKRAFAPDEGPQLLIKTINAPLRPLAEDEVLWARGGREDIHVIDCSLTAPERDALMAGCDCYVSLHRSEGFGLTIAEAMAHAKPVIATAYSGNVDFITRENAYLVDFELVVVGADCEIYPADGEWADPDLEQAARLMREVATRPAEAAAKGAQAQADIASTLSRERTGAAMRARLAEILATGRGQGREASATSWPPAGAGRSTSSHW